MARINFGPWLPDLGPTENPGLIDAFNVYPHPNGYRPVRDLFTRQSLTAGTTITNSQVFAMATFAADDGTPIVFVGTGGKIWSMSLSSLTSIATDLSNASISTSGNANQMFARYGSLVIWTNKVVAPKKSTLTLGPTVFQTLGGTPPTAKFVIVIRDFVVFLNTTTDSRLMKWSALGNAEDYVASAVTQSDSQSIMDEGPIMGAVGGEYGIVFFRYSAYRITYIGSPVIFQFDKIATEFEAPGVNIINAAVRLGYTAVRMGDAVYFITTQGLAVIIGGQLFRNLSKGRTAIHFQKTSGLGANMTRVMMLAGDPAHNQVVMGLATGAQHSVEEMLLYDIDLDRFSRFSVDAAFVSTGFGVSATPFYPSNLIYVRASTGQIAVHGDIAQNVGNLPALIETSDVQHIQGRHAFVNNVRPITNHYGTTGTPMIQVGTRQRHNQSICFSATVTINANGETPQRASGLLHRYRSLMSISASWSFMTGIDVDFQADGDR